MIGLGMAMYALEQFFAQAVVKQKHLKPAELFLCRLIVAVIYILFWPVHLTGMCLRSIRD